MRIRSRSIVDLTYLIIYYLADGYGTDQFRAVFRGRELIAMDPVSKGYCDFQAAV